MRKIKWLFGIIIFIGIFIACEKTETNDNLEYGDGVKKVVQPANPLPPTFPSTVCNFREYELVGERKLDMGNVYIGNDNQYLYVYIETDYPIDERNESIKMWFDNDIENLEKRPPLGKMPYKYDGKGYEFDVKFFIDDLTVDYEEINAIVFVEVDGNGSWAKFFHDEIKERGSWWYSVEYKPQFCYH